MFELLEALPNMSWKSQLVVAAIVLTTVFGLGYLLLKDYVACVDSGGQYVKGVVGFTCVGGKKP